MHMKMITLGSTGITVPQNAFGALPVQRVTMEEAVQLLRRAYEGGMRFFDTARAYSDSEEKLGEAFGSMDRSQMVIASKTAAKTPEEFRTQLDTTLKNLRTEYLDIYQFHCVDQCYAPGDGTGMYECMLEAKAAGKIRHIGITSHKIGVAMECVASGLYETMQFPFSYLSTGKELELVQLCKEKNVGFIAMKGLAGGLITHSEAAMAFMLQYDNVLPIWGIQRPKELEEWLAFMDNPPAMNAELEAFIAQERKELLGEFCRGCGYCMPCPVGITINQCARMSLMLRRAPSAAWLNDYWQGEMAKVPECIHCGRCATRCPYELKPYELIAKNYEDYQQVLAGKVSVK